MSDQADRHKEHQSKRCEKGSGDFHGEGIQSGFKVSSWRLFSWRLLLGSLEDQIKIVGTTLSVGMEPIDTGEGGRVEPPLKLVLGGEVAVAGVFLIATPGEQGVSWLKMGEVYAPFTAFLTLLVVGFPGQDLALKPGMKVGTPYRSGEDTGRLEVPGEGGQQKLAPCGARNMVEDAKEGDEVKFGTAEGGVKIGTQKFQLKEPWILEMGEVIRREAQQFAVFIKPQVTNLSTRGCKVESEAGVTTADVENIQGSPLGSQVGDHPFPTPPGTGATGIEGFGEAGVETSVEVHQVVDRRVIHQ
jgi:hypothetical protein